MTIHGAFLIFACLIFLCAQDVIKKQFSFKCQDGSMTFSAMVTFFALLFFLVSSGGFELKAEYIPYSLGFAFCYSTATVTGFLAIKSGSLALTSLIGAYSLVIPTMHGLIFLKETAGILQYLGIGILLVSLFLVRGSNDEKSNIRITPKWIAYVSICFVTNGMCSVLQKTQQRVFDGAYDTSFMIVALACGVIAMLIVSLIMERKIMLTVIKKGIVYAGLCGISNGIVNLLVMVIVAFVASSIFFPVLSAGQMIITFLLSVFLYKEKFLPRQVAGIGCGVIALIFLNL